MIFGNIGPFPPYLSPYNLFNSPSLEFPSQGTVTEQVTLLWFYLKQIDKILDELKENEVDISKYYTKEQINDDILPSIFKTILVNKENQEVIDKEQNERLSSLENKPSGLTLEPLKLNEQSMIYLQPGLSTQNNSYILGNYYIIDISVFNSNTNDININSNTIIVPFDNEVLLNLTDDQINANSHCIQSYCYGYNVKELHFGKLGVDPPVSIIAGDSGVTFPSAKTLRITGTIKV